MAIDEFEQGESLFGSCRWPTGATLLAVSQSLLSWPHQAHLKCHRWPDGGIQQRHQDRHPSRSRHGRIRFDNPTPVEGHISWEAWRLTRE